MLRQETVTKTGHDEAETFLLQLRALGTPRIPGLPNKLSLERLLAARQLLGIDDTEPGHLLAAAQRIARRFVNGTGLEDGLFILAQEIDREIVRAIAYLSPSEVHEAGLIRSSDFQESGLRPLSVPVLTGDSRTFLCGFVDVLPAGHPLRTALPDHEQMPFENSTVGRHLCIVLGPYASTLVGPATPRKFYLLDAALRLTRTLAHRHHEFTKRRALEQAERDAADERARLAAESPAQAERRRLQQRLGELEHEVLTLKAKP
jgi:hypothetical protein